MCGFREMPFLFRVAIKTRTGRCCVLQAVLDGHVSSCAQRADAIWGWLFVVPSQSGSGGVADSIDRGGDATSVSAPPCIGYASSAAGPFHSRATTPRAPNCCSASWRDASCSACRCGCACACAATARPGSRSRTDPRDGFRRDSQTGPSRAEDESAVRVREASAEIRAQWSAGHL